MKAAEIAARAASVVAGDRARTHGDMRTNFGLISRLWGAYLNRPVAAEDVAVMMLLLKIARSQTGHVYEPDHYVDMCGYAACAGEIASAGEDV